MSDTEPVGQIQGGGVLNVSLRIWCEERFEYLDYVATIRNADPAEYRALHHRPPLQIVTRALVY